jgi:ubiquinone/menaquinone biosynthesis C-methylase UbiE
MNSTTNNKNQILKTIEINENGKESIINLISGQTRINKNIVQRIIEEAIKGILNDDTIYKKLHNHISDFNKDDNYIQRRANNTAYKIFKLLKNIKFNNKNLLDVGCGDGSITLAVTKQLKILNTPNCVDVENWFDTYNEKTKLINLKYTNGKNIDFESNSMDIIMALHSLHHIKDLDDMLNEISRVLKKGGIFVIKEHDCNNENTQLTIDIFHSIYAMVLTENPTESFLDEYYAKYFSYDQLKDLLDTKGFKILKKIFEPSAIKNYYAVYVKVK